MKNAHNILNTKNWEQTRPEKIVAEKPSSSNSGAIRAFHGINENTQKAHATGNAEFNYQKNRGIAQITKPDPKLNLQSDMRYNIVTGSLQ